MQATVTEVAAVQLTLSNTADRQLCHEYPHKLQNCDSVALTPLCYHLQSKRFSKKEFNYGYSVFVSVALSHHRISRLQHFHHTAKAQGFKKNLKSPFCDMGHHFFELSERDARYLKSQSSEHNR
jgi:hypothetical protein